MLRVSVKVGNRATVKVKLTKVIMSSFNFP